MQDAVSVFLRTSKSHYASRHKSPWHCIGFQLFVDCHHILTSCRRDLCRQKLRRSLTDYDLCAKTSHAVDGVAEIWQVLTVTGCTHQVDLGRGIGVGVWHQGGRVKNLSLFSPHGIIESEWCGKVPETDYQGQACCFVSVSGAGGIG